MREVGDATDGRDGSGADVPNEDGTAALRGVRTVLETAGQVGAPLTMLAGVAYYIGAVRHESLYLHLGIAPSLVEFSSTEYVIRSADSIIRFLTIMLVVGTVASVAYRQLDRLVDSLRTDRRARAVLALGVLLTIAGLAVLGSFAGSLRAGPATIWIGPTCLIVGVSIVNLGLFRLEAIPLPRRTTALRVGIATIAVLGVFWLANDYARIQGQARAAVLLEQLDAWALPVTLRSAEPLGLGTMPGVVETDLGDAGGAMPYEVAGLRLVTRNQGRWFLAPRSWSGTSGSVVVVPEDGSIRLETRHVLQEGGP